MKNNTFFKLFLIMLAALTLRVWCLDKPEGLWNDEYVGWYISSISNLQEFFKTALQNCHTPLYYFYLKIWMLMFGDTDISLRWSSVIPSMFSIIAMYFLGKELNGKKVGLLCAILTAISSFCIYFAQEVRLYSLLFLLSALVSLYFIKTAKEPNKNNFIIYFCLNAILCATHTLGIIFSIFNIACLLFYINKYLEHLDKEKIFKILKYITPFIVVVILISPFLITISTSKNLSQFWSNFSLTKIACTFIDYYSPVQTNIQNTFNSFTSYLMQGKYLNVAFIIFALIPTLIGLLMSAKSLFERNKILNYLAFSSGMFFLTLILLSTFGKMIIITKYSIEIYPILILMCAIGFMSLKQNILKKVLLFIFIGLNLFYLFTAEDSAPKRTRSEGHLAVVDLIKNSNLKQNDYIVITYYNREKFDRYIEDKSKYNFLSINKFDFNYYLFDEENYFDVLKTAKDKHKDFFAEYPNKTIKEYAKNKFLNKMKKGDRVGIVVLDNVSFIDNKNLQEILKDKNKYDKTSLIFLIFSALKNNLVEILNNELTIETTTHKGDWTLYVFVKDN